MKKDTPREESLSLYKELINVFKDRDRPDMRILAL